MFQEQDNTKKDKRASVPGIFKNTINSHLINNKLSSNQMRNASPTEFQRRYSLGWKKASQK